MSRSHKRIPIFKYIGNSNKISKRLCNRKFRKRSKVSLLKDQSPPQKLDEVMTEWEFLGDGRKYIQDVPEKFLRK